MKPSTLRSRMAKLGITRGGRSDSAATTRRLAHPNQTSSPRADLVEHDQGFIAQQDAHALEDLKFARLEERVGRGGRLPFGLERERVRIVGVDEQAAAPMQPGACRMRSTISSTTLRISSRLWGCARKLTDARSMLGCIHLCNLHTLPVRERFTEKTPMSGAATDGPPTVGRGTPRCPRTGATFGGRRAPGRGGHREV